MLDFVTIDEQQAILQYPSPSTGRFLAGPGTGKSATIVALIERLLTAPLWPRNKLLTFTRAATGELAKKIADPPSAASERPSIIHSFAISLLLRKSGSDGFP
jgi:ATP-dependent exoDNAse (exonuclease V) beta subunit